MYTEHFVRHYPRFIDLFVGSEAAPAPAGLSGFLDRIFCQVRSDVVRLEPTLPGRAFELSVHSKRWIVRCAAFFPRVLTRRAAPVPSLPRRPQLFHNPEQVLELVIQSEILETLFSKVRSCSASCETAETLCSQDGSPRRNRRRNSAR